MPVDPASDAELDALGEVITRWAEGQRDTNDMIQAVDRMPEQRRWFIRIRGEEKTVTTVWLWLRERTLHYESQFMPAPEENREAVFEMLLRLNARLFAMRFAIGDEDAVYLVGQLPWAAVDEDEIDRIVGATYAYSEQWFRPAMRLGYASKFRG
ncbi:MAG TPA: YbjN domain-containing protein [Acidimicrobiales bacterium]|nr:YbjN domain-containing protein [Acidimicrobiales bacterium]